MTENNWIEKIIEETQKSHNNTNEVVVSRVRELLLGEFAKRKFTPAEIKNIAEQLIADLSNENLNGIEKNENKIN